MRDFKMPKRLDCEESVILHITVNSWLKPFEAGGVTLGIHCAASFCHPLKEAQ